MTTEHEFAALRTLELTDEEVRAVLARRRRPRGSRALAVGLAFAAAVLVAAAVPRAGRSWKMPSARSSTAARSPASGFRPRSFPTGCARFASRPRGSHV
jgi:hypothetical protein